MGLTLATDRLIMRQWRHSDREPFAEINSDPEVMEHFTTALTREESDAFADRIEARLEANGFGLWAVEVRGGPPFVGYVGLADGDFEAPFMPAMEVG